MSLTINENGKALTETQQGVTMPVDYSFECVNDFVHSPETHYEDLECLCLGMANEIEKLKERLAYAETAVSLMGKEIIEWTPSSKVEQGEKDFEQHLRIIRGELDLKGVADEML